MYSTIMKWICVYCNKIMDKSNFTEFIADSDNRDAEYHGWKFITDTDITAIQLKQNQKPMMRRLEASKSNSLVPFQEASMI